MTNIRFNITGVPYMILVENKKMYEMDLFPNYDNLKDFIFTNFTEVKEELKPLPKKVKFAYVAWLILKQTLDDITNNINLFMKNKGIKFQFNTWGFILFIISFIILTCWGVIRMCLKFCCNDDDILLELQRMEEEFKNKKHNENEQNEQINENKEVEEEDEEGAEYEIEEEEEDDEEVERVQENEEKEEKKGEEKIKKEKTEEEKKKEIEEQKEREQKEKEEKERLEREQKEKEEKERLEREQKEKEEKERLEREQKEKEEKERLEKEKKEKEEKERLEKEQKEKEEKERAKKLIEEKKKKEEELKNIKKNEINNNKNKLPINDKNTDNFLEKFINQDNRQKTKKASNNNISSNPKQVPKKNTNVESTKKRPGLVALGYNPPPNMINNNKPKKTTKNNNPHIKKDSHKTNDKNNNNNNEINNKDDNPNEEGMTIAEYWSKFGGKAPPQYRGGERNYDNQKITFKRQPVKIDKSLGVKKCEFCSNYVDNLPKHYLECNAKKMIDRKSVV